QTKENWLKNKAEISKVINDWAKSWQTKDFKTYINSYSKAEFRHPIKGRYNAFKTYKRHVFNRSDKPIIELSNRSILSNGEYVVVTMMQNYDSPIVKDIGKKTLYMKRNSHYEWKIVAEEWSRINEERRNIAFTPKMRYFTKPNKEDMSNDSESI
ncbi:MAG: hypothetical protein OEW87_15405, partial [Flavobacteriaceae bacterium]|nr:hypothetical protein [Flavobacteriaceae bacterium]